MDLVTGLDKFLPGPQPFLGDSKKFKMKISDIFNNVFPLFSEQLTHNVDSPFKFTFLKSQFFIYLLFKLFFLIVMLQGGRV